MTEAPDYRHRCTTNECLYFGKLTDQLSCGCHRKEAEIMRSTLDNLTTPRPISEYHEDMGDVLWWKFPIVEPPYVGSPISRGFETKLLTPMGTYEMVIGGWPGYHTHFTMIPTPRNHDDQSTKPEG